MEPKLTMCSLSTSQGRIVGADTPTQELSARVPPSPAARAAAASRTSSAVACSSAAGKRAVAIRAMTGLPTRAAHASNRQTLMPRTRTGDRHRRPCTQMVSLGCVREDGFYHSDASPTKRHVHVAGIPSQREDCRSRVLNHRFGGPNGI